MSEFASKFSALETGSLRGRSWERFVINETTNSLKSLLDRYSNLISGTPPIIPEWSRAPEGRFFEEMYALELKALEAQTPREEEAFNARRSLYYKGFAERIRSRNEYSILGKLNKLKEEHPPDEITHIAASQIGLSTLYLMVCESDRFLVGLKGGPQWKKVRIAEVPGLISNAIPMAIQYMQVMDKIGKRELEVVPDTLIHNGQLQEVQIPDSSPDLEGVLEDAYFRQRYIVDTEGSEVRYRNAGDVTRTIIIQQGDELMARVFTAYGDEFVSINLQDASYGGVDKLRNANQIQASSSNKWTRLVADSYRDLVTAEEVSSMGSNLKAIGSDIVSPWMKQVVEQPQVIYIPRKYKRNTAIPDTSEDDRASYDGQPRVKPHHVGGHKRIGNMTDEHREALYKFEKDHKLERGTIVDHVPAGYTFVRPHFSPAESADYVQYLPVYIKRRVGEQIARQLQDPRIILN